MKFSRSEIEANGTTVISGIKKHGTSGKSRMYKYIIDASRMYREEIDFTIGHMVEYGWVIPEKVGRKITYRMSDFRANENEYIPRAGTLSVSDWEIERENERISRLSKG